MYFLFNLFQLRSFLFQRLAVCALFCIVLSQSLNAQVLTQTIRGSVVDKVSQSPIAGAIVVLVNAVPAKGTATDLEGRFLLKDVPVGRQSVKVTYIGYKESVISNIAVNSGKEVVLTIEMQENIVEAKEVVVSANKQKNKPQNELLTVSARTFSVEETQKFAAAVNDPARMATSFAGVVQGDDGNNYISIRGNSPNSMLWRMEGVDIPNPNHFSSVGTSGGGISILSAQLMSNSDFLTGAFTPEYGNALSGVFDIRLRKGNNQKRENTIQAGLLGLDFAAEGPFKKGYGGSYLINYRYSTLSLLSLVGVPIGSGITTFQDLSFNISLPAGKAGVFGAFGFGGLSGQKITAEKDSMKWREDNFYRYNSRFKANAGATGINHMILLGKKTYLRSSFVFSGTDHNTKDGELDENYVAQENTNDRFINTKVTLTTVLNHKINARNSLRTGVILNRLHYNLRQEHRNDSLQIMQTEIASSGNTGTVQSYINWNHQANERLSMNVGFHTLQLLLNGTASVEPRASVKYEVKNGQTLGIGYGLHSQIQPLGAYFALSEGGSGMRINKDLKMSKAHHMVVSYDVSISSHTHVKTEVYYQHLFNVPVATKPGSAFSLLNLTDGYITEKLVNEGLGKNYGVELTLERFLHKNFYYLLSASLYESKYRTADGRWFNTMFNTGRSTSFTAGKEWQLSEKRKNKIIGFNLKVIYAGGLRYTPIDLQTSIAKGDTRYFDNKSFTLQNPDYFRTDIKISIKRNFKHATGTLALDIQNVSNRKNVGGRYYNPNTGTVKYWYQAPLIPILSYRLEF